MSGVSRWQDSGHLERAVETAGGKEAFDVAVAAMLVSIQGKRPHAIITGTRRHAGTRWHTPVVCQVIFDGLLPADA